MAERERDARVARRAGRSRFREMSRVAPALLALLLVLRGARADEGADRAFDALARKYLEEFPALSPVGATQLGDHRFDGELDQVGAEAREREVEFCRRWVAKLDSSVALDRLSRDRRVDAELLRHDLGGTIWRIEKLREWEWNPLRYTGLAGNAVYSLLARDYAPIAQRLRHVASRLEGFPRLLAQARETLRPARVPKVHAETAVRQNRGVLSIIQNLVEPRLGELPAADRERLERAIATARRAVEKQQQWLEKELLPAAGGDFRIGAKLFDQKLAFTLNSSLSREEIRRRAESELERVRREMWEISRGVYLREYPSTRFPQRPSPAYRQAIVRAALEVAYRDVPPADGVVEAAKRALAEATEFVREKKLVSVPSDPVEIIIMPEFRRGVSVAYCDSPGPLDVGQKTFYAVSPLPEDWTEKQVGSFLREYNRYSINDLTIHEAMPGHFLQLAHSNRYPSTLRAVLSSGVFIEGWAVYAEQMMADEGFPDGDPLQKLIARKWYLRGIANAIMDQKIHVEGMTREEAMRLMVEDTFQEEREAAGKWTRAQLTSTQLSTYFVGYQEHVDLRRAVERARGASFDLGKYHDEVLAHGSPPVRYVREILLGEGR